MAESSLARPYARAAFEYAHAAGGMAAWSEGLALLATVAADPRVARVLGDPRITRERRGELLIEICGDALVTGQDNFIRLLAANARLQLIEAIQARFEALRAEAENRLDAEVVTAHPLDEARQQRLAEVLGKRLGRDVQLQARVDDQIIGGLIVRAGDLVIDASLRGSIDRLKSRIAH